MTKLNLFLETLNHERTLSFPSLKRQITSFLEFTIFYFYQCIRGVLIVGLAYQGKDIVSRLIIEL